LYLQQGIKKEHFCQEERILIMMKLSVHKEEETSVQILSQPLKDESKLQKQIGDLAKKSNTKTHLSSRIGEEDRLDSSEDEFDVFSISSTSDMIKDFSAGKGI